MFAKYRYNSVLLPKAMCRECYKPSRKKYYQSNAATIIEKISDYQKANRKTINDTRKNRYQNDSVFRIRELIRSAIKMTLKRSKNGDSINKYLPYSIQELKEHLEKQFEPWMTWDNHGKYDLSTWNDNDTSTWTWQLDHIVPQSDLLYQTMEDDNFQKCWSLDNLRPYSAKQNIIDGPSRIRHRS
jgi:hypothetical protein